MARVNLMKNIVTSRRQPHTPLDNVNTPYNPIRWTVTHIISSFCMIMLQRRSLFVQKFHILCLRLLKGAPPGQEAVNHYISELSIVKTGNHKLDTKYRKHLAMVEVSLLIDQLFCNQLCYI